jgi:KUP system potassium uptake protein
LAAAYGVAVTAVMATTSILLFFVGRIVWKWPIWYLLPIVAFFLVIDLAFFGANILKVPEGGWYPLAIALILVLLMTTWRKGRALLERRNMQPLVKLDEFLGEVVESKPDCIEGTGVFMTGVPDTIPTSLMGLYRHMPVVYEKMIILSMQPVPIARLPRSKQFELKDLGNGFWLLVGHYGYMQIPNVPRLLQLAARQGLEVDLRTVSYYTRREIVVTTGSMPMMGWRKGVFAAMSRNAQAMSDVFELPTDRVIEIGMRVDI